MRTDIRTYITDKFISEDMEKIERIINSIEINEKKS